MRSRCLSSSPHGAAIGAREKYRESIGQLQDSAGAGGAALSPQEMRLLKQLTQGHQNKTAAAELGISIHTVSFHLRSIYGKLHVHSRSEAVARALRDGLVE